ncbi:MAG: hypothetical protein M1814_000540 [Vezdaea aestivalis]|nr:MAG: hypothetical protein M1814_000540 [Vezdaea aestivalis]
MLLGPLLLSLWTLQASAVTLYVATYAGYITSLKLTRQGTTFKLTNLSSTAYSAPSPSWLTLDKSRRLLYAVDEGAYGTNGSFSSYRTGRNGTLAPLHRINTTFGPVDAAIFGPDPHARYAALPIYGSAGLQTYLLDNAGAMTLKQNLTFTLPAPGPKAAQSVSRPHGVTKDPTGRYLVVPDLGADLLRVYSLGSHSNNTYLPTNSTARAAFYPVNSTATNSTKNLIELPSIKLPPGSGPRHAAFSPIRTFASSTNLTATLYVVSELSSTLTTFTAHYLPGRISFTPLDTTPTYPPGTKAPASIAAAEVAVSPDGRFVVVSNRNDSAFSIPNSDPANTTAEASDSLISYKLEERTGKPIFDQFAPAGGLFPRMFRFDRLGTRIAVGCQTSNRTVILERDNVSGKIGKVLASYKMEGPVGCVIWDE